MVIACVMFNLAVIIIPATVLIAFFGLRLWKIGQNVFTLDKSGKQKSASKDLVMAGSIRVCNGMLSSCISCLVSQDEDKSRFCKRAVDNFYYEFVSYRGKYSVEGNEEKWEVYLYNLWDSGMRFAELSYKIASDYGNLPNAESGQLKVIDNRLNDLLTLVDANSPNIATRIDEIKEELDVFIKIYSRSFNRNNRKEDGIYSLFLTLMNHLNTYLISLQKAIACVGNQE